MARVAGYGPWPVSGVTGPISNECGKQLRLVGYEKSPPEPLECHMTSASHIIIVDGKVLACDQIHLSMWKQGWPYSRGGLQ